MTALPLDVQAAAPLRGRHSSPRAARATRRRAVVARGLHPRGAMFGCCLPSSTPASRQPAAASAVAIPAAPMTAVSAVATVGRAAAVPERLYWTRRGLAVILAVIAGVVGFLMVTLVTAFLAVSNEPLFDLPAGSVLALSRSAPPGPA